MCEKKAYVFPKCTGEHTENLEKIPEFLYKDQSEGFLICLYKGKCSDL